MEESKEDRDEMRSEYGFSSGQRGKYAHRFEKGSNVVVLDPDLAELFPDSESVNRALRALHTNLPTGLCLTIIDTEGHQRRRAAPSAACCC